MQSSIFKSFGGRFSLLALLFFSLSAFGVNEFSYVLTPKIDAGNIRITGNTLSSLDTNGNFTIDLNGTGATIFTDLTATTVPYLDASKKLTSSAVTPTQLALLGTATSANTASTLVQRDGSGNFTAGTVTATSFVGALTGNASTVTTNANLTGDVTSSGNATTIGATKVTNGMLAGSIAASKLVATDIATVGTITSGTWNGTTIAIANGGTGQTSKAAAFDALAPCTSGGGGLITYGSGSNSCLTTAIGDLGKPLISAGALGPNTYGTAVAAGGGTGQSSYTTGDTLYASGTTALSKLGIGSTGQVLKVSGGIPAWGTAQGGLISDREMITNSDIEVDASGYTAYADAAGVLPVDCTGGSPNSTVARSTSTPITGTGELLWTKAGTANRQGEGFSIPFTVGTADQAKVLQIDLDTIVRSGTFVAGSSTTDSDLEFYVYDVTNSTLIQPSTYKIYSSSTSLSAHSTLNFQTSSSGTSYRFCVHQATTVTANVTMGLDNISIHPSRYVYGTPITDWVSYTPTFTGMGTVASSVFYSRRVGDSLEVNGRVVIGTSTGTPALITLGYGGTNANVTVDTSKVPTGNIVGDASVSTSAATTMRWAILAPASNVTNVIATIQTSTISTNTASTNASTVFSGAGQTMIVNFKVPIVGWSSGVQMSDSAPQATVAMRATGSSTSISNSGNTAVIFPTVSYDTTGGYNSTTGVYTVSVPGKYHVCEYMQTNAAVYATTGAFVAMIYKNGSQYSQISADNNKGTGNSASTFWTSPGSCDDIDLKGGDTLQIYAASNATIALNNAVGYFAVNRIGNAGTIGATEFVGAKYSNSAGTSITNSGSDINVPFATKVFDSHSAFSGTVYTVPVSGKYRVSGTVNFQAAVYVVGNTVFASVYQNSAIASYGPVLSIDTTTSTNYGVSVSTTLSCNAGDTIEVRAANNRTAGATSLTASASNNHIEIERIGM